MTEEFIITLIGDAAQVNDTASVNTLTDMLNELRNPTPVKVKKASPNKTGYVQVDPETGKEVARYETIAQANEAMGKKKTASCISQACRNVKLNKSNFCYGFKWYYGSDFEA